MLSVMRCFELVMVAVYLLQGVVTEESGSQSTPRVRRPSGTFTAVSLVYPSLQVRSEPVAVNEVDINHVDHGINHVDQEEEQHTHLSDQHDHEDEHDEDRDRRVLGVNTTSYLLIPNEKTRWMERPMSTEILTNQSLSLTSRKLMDKKEKSQEQVSSTTLSSLTSSSSPPTTSPPPSPPTPSPSTAPPPTPPSTAPPPTPPLRDLEDVPSEQWSERKAPLEETIMKGLEEILDLELPHHQQGVRRGARVERDHKAQDRRDEGPNIHQNGDYEFAYSVSDEHTGFLHSREERKVANLVVGSYEVTEHLAGTNACRVRRVEYEASEEKGFEVRSVSRTRCHNNINKKNQDHVSNKEVDAKATKRQRGGRRSRTRPLGTSSIDRDLYRRHPMRPVKKRRRKVVRRLNRTRNRNLDDVIKKQGHKENSDRFPNFKPVYKNEGAEGDERDEETFVPLRPVVNEERRQRQRIEESGENSINPLASAIAPHHDSTQDMSKPQPPFTTPTLRASQRPGQQPNPSVYSVLSTQKSNSDDPYSSPEITNVQQLPTPRPEILNPFSTPTPQVLNPFSTPIPEVLKPTPRPEVLDPPPRVNEGQEGSFNSFQPPLQSSPTFNSQPFGSPRPDQPAPSSYFASPQTPKVLAPVLNQRPWSSILRGQQPPPPPPSRPQAALPQPTTGQSPTPRPEQPVPSSYFASSKLPRPSSAYLPPIPTLRPQATTPPPYSSNIPQNPPPPPFTVKPFPTRQWNPTSRPEKPAPSSYFASSKQPNPSPPFPSSRPLLRPQPTTPPPYASSLPQRPSPPPFTVKPFQRARPNPTLRPEQPAPSSYFASSKLPRPSSAYLPPIPTLRPQATTPPPYSSNLPQRPSPPPFTVKPFQRPRPNPTSRPKQQVPSPYFVSSQQPKPSPPFPSSRPILRPQPKTPPPYSSNLPQRPSPPPFTVKPFQRPRPNPTLRPEQPAPSSYFASSQQPKPEPSLPSSRPTLRPQQATLPSFSDPTQQPEVLRQLPELESDPPSSPEQPSPSYYSESSLLSTEEEDLSLAKPTQPASSPYTSSSALKDPNVILGSFVPVETSVMPTSSPQTHPVAVDPDATTTPELVHISSRPSLSSSTKESGRRKMLMNIILRPGDITRSARSLPKPKVDVYSESSNTIVIRLTFPADQTIRGLRAFSPLSDDDDDDDQRLKGVEEVDGRRVHIIRATNIDDTNLDNGKFVKLRRPRKVVGKDSDNLALGVTKASVEELTTTTTTTSTTTTTTTTTTSSIPDTTSTSSTTTERSNPSHSSTLLIDDNISNDGHEPQREFLSRRVNSMKGNFVINGNEQQPASQPGEEGEQEQLEQSQPSEPPRSTSTPSLSPYQTTWPHSSSSNFSPTTIMGSFVPNEEKFLPKVQPHHHQHVAAHHQMQPQRPAHQLRPKRQRPSSSFIEGFIAPASSSGWRPTHGFKRPYVVGGGQGALGHRGVGGSHRPQRHLRKHQSKQVRRAKRRPQRLNTFIPGFMVPAKNAFMNMFKP